MKYLYLLTAIIAEVIGTSFLKNSNGFTKLFPSLVVVVGYGIAFYFLSLSLRFIPIGIAYAIWSGVGMVLVALIGVFVFKESLDLSAMIGIVLIIFGVLILNLFSKVASH